MLNSRLWFRPVAGCLVSVAACIAGCSSGKPADLQQNESTQVPHAPALPASAEQRTAGLKQAMIDRNPGLTADQILTQADEEGQLVALEIRDAGVTNLSPLAGWPLTLLGLAGNPVVDLSPLQGMPLQELDLERTRVVDLSPLAGAPLQHLWLNETGVSDLKPLSRCPLSQLSLPGTPVSDLAPLRGLPLEQLWLSDTQVTDLSPLANAPLVSLTLHRTPVSDLTIARTWPGLQRLHIGESRITDLSPLKDLRLRRLILTPARITTGLEVVRTMDTLTELDVEFRQPQLWSPEEFWQHYEAGELR